MGKAKKSSGNDNTIALNKKARHDYTINETIEAGVSLEGWEVKSLRDKRVNLTDAYVMLQGQEVFLIGALITPLLSASTHVSPTPMRARKLLLHRRELDKLHDAVKTQGLTIVPLVVYLKSRRIKLLIGLARGKKVHDKRAAIKERDQKREMQRALREHR